MANKTPLDMGLLGELTGFELKIAWIRAYNLLTAEVDDPAVTPLRLSMLELVGCNPGAAHGQLGTALNLSRSAATLTVDFWQDRGCIERRPDRSDRRSVGVYLTPQGETELSRLRKRIRTSDEALIAGLGSSEVATLRALLARIQE